MSDSKAPPPALPPLYKQKSWSPDTYRDEAWLKRKDSNRRRRRRSLSVTDDDLDELKACIELGFGFDFGSDSPDFDRRLSDTLPALGLYYAVNKSFSDSMSVSSTAASSSSGDGSSSPLDSPHHILSLSDGNPEVVKARLRQWAQVVACTVRQSPDFPSGVRSEKMV